MLKSKIFEKFQHYFEDYLFGFDKNQLQMSLLKGSIDMKNLNIKPDKLNEDFAKGGLPIALKAGLISKLTIKVSGNVLIHISSPSLACFLSQSKSPLMIS